MKYRVSEIEVPDDDFYKYDILDRKPTVDFIQNFLSSAGGPFVLAIDSPWGTGKTTFVRMLQKTLQKNNLQCIYFNAWKVDYASDPLVALVSALDETAPKNSDVERGFRKHMSTVKKLTSSVVKHGLVAATKAATLGAMDIDSAIEDVVADMAGGVTKDLVDSFKAEKVSLDLLREEIQKSIKALCGDQEKKSLIFFIDELDRCRPLFSIEMLERIKHLFDVERLIFVLSIDKNQLEASICAVYGEKFDAAEYLRRFFDLELRLPQPDPKRFSKIQLERFGLKEYFDERRKSYATQYDGDNLIESIAELTKFFNLSLRSVERVMARVALVCSQTPGNNYFDPHLVAFLVVLRMKNIKLFNDIVTGVDPEEVMSYIKSLPGGIDLISSHFGLILETYLLVGDENGERSRERRRKFEQLYANRGDTEEALRARSILKMMEWVPGSGRYHFSTSKIANKVDLASTLN